MKAIQVKYLNVTNTKPARLKILAEGLPSITKNVDDFDNHPFKSVEQQGAELLANKYKWLEYNNWTESETILRGGQIANGDHVFVFIEIPHAVKKSFIEFKEV